MEKNSKKIIDDNELELLALPEDVYNDLILWLDASSIYYNGSDDGDDEFLMSDEQFDNLTETLSEYGEKAPILLRIINSKIQTADGLVDVEEVQSQMISLFKIKHNGMMTHNEIQRFVNPKRQNLDMFMGLKYDGMAIKNSNQNGKIQILTRGGQDVTDLLINHRDFVNITRPITHGELVIKKSVFYEKYDKEKFEDGYENPRNCILGVLKKCADDLDFIECTDGINPLVGNNVWKKLEHINLEQYYFQEKEKTEYQIDGMVIGHVVETQEIKDNYPLNLVSIKFKSPTVQTVVEKFEWTQKKSANLTPVIWVKPVKLDGSTITKVTGYNYENVKLAHIGIGSIIEITKSGDIIPVVKKVISRSTNINMPDVEYTIRGKHLVAVDQQESRIYKFILGLKLLQIDGIGPVIAENIGKVIDYDIIELFNSNNKPAIIGVLGNGSTWHKFDILYQTKTIGLDLLIEILQFDRCGKTLSKRFAEIILRQNNDTSGIDKTVLANVCRGDGFKKINESMLKLKEYGVKVIKPIEVSEDTITFEMTGNPPGMTKNEFIAKLKIQYPNSIHTTLTQDTKYLFTDDINGTSGKCNKARKNNTKIISYSDALLGKL